MVIIEMEDGRKIELEMQPEAAPNSVRNFLYLANKGFYDGLTFHRVIKGFMIQGGCPEGSGMGGPGYSIKGEFAEAGFNNTLRHSRGVISMARAMDYDSAGSQFFIMHANGFFLDGQYAAFGHVVSGMDVVDDIACTRTGANDKPKTPQIIKKITVVDEGEIVEPERV
ncbi:MAG: peptidylprolyl isomerase [Bacillota bacterium]|nr:peptidylprolyl isomerase [Bacillota bacterium]